MSWTSSSLVRIREQFVLDALRGQVSFVGLCGRYQIARSCGYKWLQRYRELGRSGLQNRSSRPKESPRTMARRWQQALRRLRRRHPTWGPRKLRVGLRAQAPRARLPSARSLGRWLRRWGLSARHRRRARRGPRVPRPTRLLPERSNQVWTVDFKGWFRTGNGSRVEPLTVRDLFSRCLLGFRLLPDQSDGPVRRAFRQVFRRHGLPEVIRCDNGAPFGGCGPRGYSRLSVWWRRLGIRVEFGRPAHPEDNAGHEQMHGVYQREAAWDPAFTPAAQQRRTHRWVQTFNHWRPHEALAMRVPAAVHRPSHRLWPHRLPCWVYPHRWPRVRVDAKGYIRWQCRGRFIGRAFAKECLGLKPLSIGVWAVQLGPDLLGHLHAADSHESPRPVQLINDPIAP